MFESPVKYRSELIEIEMLNDIVSEGSDKGLHKLYADPDFQLRPGIC